MSHAEQEKRSTRSGPGEGRLTLRTMATLLAHTDLVLLEPCATHMHTVDKYRTSVDTAIDLMVHGARWAWASRPSR